MNKGTSINQRRRENQPYVSLTALTDPENLFKYLSKRSRIMLFPFFILSGKSDRWLKEVKYLF